MANIHFRPYTPNQTVFFPQRIDADIAADAPVRIVNAIVDSLDLDNFSRLYKATGRCPYHPKMMLKAIHSEDAMAGFPAQGWRMPVMVRKKTTDSCRRTG